ncbi:MAG: class I tRNA ligase family protein, partial [Candidatus Margulisiibacteriota bacterium]
MGEYKDTLNLPQTEMPMRANLALREPAILEAWEKTDIYKLSLAKNKGKTEFLLHDGPPYPNGNIHVGHALNKTLKDIVVKYKTMKGFHSTFIPGWDCHGLPIETQLLKEIKNSKEPVPPAAEFRERCKDYALKYVDIQREQFKRLGVRGDWANPYLTLSEEYEKNVYAMFDKLYKKGYVVRGRKPIHWCYDCKTALAEAEIEYADVRSASIYIKFKSIKNPLNIKDLNLIVWTTTPWTLPANVAVAVHPKFNYAIVKANGQHWAMAENLVNQVMGKIGWTEFTIEKTVTGRDLEGTVCQHPFYDREAPVVCAEYVTAEDGTGCVHIAPGHGQEDHVVGKEYGLPVLMPVNDAGVLTEEAGIFAGLHVNEANKAIGKHMEENG